MAYTTNRLGSNLSASLSNLSLSSAEEVRSSMSSYATSQPSMIARDKPLPPLPRSASPASSAGRHDDGRALLLVPLPPSRSFQPHDLPSIIIERPFEAGSHQIGRSKTTRRHDSTGSKTVTKRQASPEDDTRTSTSTGERTSFSPVSPLALARLNMRQTSLFDGPSSRFSVFSDDDSDEASGIRTNLFSYLRKAASSRPSTAESGRSGRSAAKGSAMSEASELPERSPLHRPDPTRLYLNPLAGAARRPPSPATSQAARGQTPSLRPEARTARPNLHRIRSALQRSMSQLQTAISRAMTSLTQLPKTRRRAALKRKIRILEVDERRNSKAR